MAAPALRGSLLALGATRRATAHGPFDVAEFRNVATHRSAFALVRGDVRGDEPVLCRVHSSCVTSEFLGACDCDCAGQLEAALAAIDGEGRGVLFYLAQEGRGAGIVAKARDRMIVQASRHRTTTFEAYERMGLHPDARRYGEVADACALLGVEAPLVVLSNNPGKVSALEREKLRVAEMRPLARDASPFNAHYLEAKRASGHVLGTARADAAELPRAVACTTPRPLHGLPDVLHVATYLLPVGGSIDAPVWVELDAFVDLASRAERIALRGGAAAGGALRVRRQPEPVLERFALEPAPARAAWRRLALAGEREAAWLAVLSPRDARGASAGADAAERELRLLAALAREAGAERVVADAVAGEPDPVDGLRAAGLDAVAAPALDPASTPGLDLGVASASPTAPAMARSPRATRRP